MPRPRGLQRDDGRIIIHFDYDCFYAAVVEKENPALQAVPLAIQQKQIVVTCNYEARRRGLKKLQLVAEARRVCPDLVIVLGEDLTRFRDASKDLYAFLHRAVWSGRAERLGFDEVWLDCTDMVDYNMSTLNRHNLAHAFFCLDPDDPTRGFDYDATTVFGPTYPAARDAREPDARDGELHQRLVLGSHLARHLRHALEAEKGYTATVGVATNKMLAKLVGNVHKPKNQTTLMPPLEPVAGQPATSVTTFLDGHELGRIPGIGFRLSQKIRARVLGRAPDFSATFVHGGTRESVTVADVRAHPGMGPALLDEILGGPGFIKGIGARVWGLLHGVDDDAVGKTKRVPSQISQEDSYKHHLRTWDAVKQQLHLLAERLIRRMHMDLLEDDDNGGGGGGGGSDEEENDGNPGTKENDGGATPVRRWIAHPRTLRLTTRPRPAPGPDGVRARTVQRISRSAPMPHFVFGLHDAPADLAARLVNEALVPMFRKLHHEPAGWNLNLINVAATNMAETAADTKDSAGRDIGRMFRTQDRVLKDFRVTDTDVDSGDGDGNAPTSLRTELVPSAWEQSASRLQGEGPADGWDSEDCNSPAVERCDVCRNTLPAFAMAAHRRYHDLSQLEQFAVADSVHD